MMNWKGFWRKQLLHLCGGFEENHKNVRIPGVLAEIQNEHLPNRLFTSRPTCSVRTIWLRHVACVWEGTDRRGRENLEKLGVKGKVIPMQAVQALRVARGWGSHILRHSAHRWQQGCRPYAPAAFYPQEDSSYSFLLEAESTPGP
jgi:hypothetical protein